MAMSFFKKLNQRNESYRKLRRFLILALGEVLLVAFAITIAIWVDERERAKVNHRIELGILQEINSNLDGDLYEIEGELEEMGRVNESCSIIIEYLNSNEPYSESLNIHFSSLILASHFNPNTGGYSFLEAKGIQLIRSPKLRNALTNHYNSLYRYYNEYQTERIEFIAEQVEPIFIGTFYNEPSLEFPCFQLSPVNNEVIKSRKLLSQIQFVQWRTRRIESRAILVRNNMLHLKKMLEVGIAEWEL